MSNVKPIRLALLGAGIFAREAHLPALRALGDTYEIAAVYSYKRSSADKLLDILPQPVEVYEDLDALLARDDIDAVDAVLPIHVLPSAVERALAAGKHVISEKPAAPSLEAGRDLLAFYERHVGPVWMVAENWRYEPAFIRAAEIVTAGEIGEPVACHWAMYIDMTPNNQYYWTAWRRSGVFSGGFLLDGGVHHVAAMRLILGEIKDVCAVDALQRSDLPPADTLSAALRFERGTVGVYHVTYAVGAPWAQPFRIAGTKGALTVWPGGIEIATGGDPQHVDLPAVRGVEAELAAFAAAVRDGQPHDNTPHQGMQDVAVIEAMLSASETGQRIAPERFVTG
jgi:predicted dehydrogenase